MKHYILHLLMLSSHAMAMQHETKSFFIDSNLEAAVSLYAHKKTQDLTRQDYISYLKAVNKEMKDSSVYIIKFLGSIRGHGIEVLKEKGANEQ